MRCEVRSLAQEECESMRCVCGVHTWGRPVSSQYWRGLGISVYPYVPEQDAQDKAEQARVGSVEYELRDLV